MKSFTVRIEFVCKEKTCNLHRALSSEKVVCCNTNPSEVVPNRRYEELCSNSKSEENTPVFVAKQTISVRPVSTFTAKKYNDSPSKANAVFSKKYSSLKVYNVDLLAPFKSILIIFAGSDGTLLLGALPNTTTYKFSLVQNNEAPPGHSPR